jgi:PatG C-terminal
VLRRDQGAGGHRDPHGPAHQNIGHRAGVLGPGDRLGHGEGGRRRRVEEITAGRDLVPGETIPARVDRWHAAGRLEAEARFGDVLFELKVPAGFSAAGIRGVDRIGDVESEEVAIRADLPLKDRPLTRTERAVAVQLAGGNQGVGIAAEQIRANQQRNPSRGRMVQRVVAEVPRGIELRNRRNVGRTIRPEALEPGSVALGRKLPPQQFPRKVFIQADQIVIGAKGPTAPPSYCNGLTVPLVVYDQIYAFDRYALIAAIPPPADVDPARFRATAEEEFDRITQIADNAGSTDAHRALNYIAVRYAGLYVAVLDAHVRNASLSAVNVRLAAISGTRRIVEVMFTFTNRTTDVAEKPFVRVDVTDQFPFLFNKLSPYFDH